MRQPSKPLTRRSELPIVSHDRKTRAHAGTRRADAGHAQPRGRRRAPEAGFRKPPARHHRGGAGGQLPLRLPTSNRWASQEPETPARSPRCARGRTLIGIHISHSVGGVFGPNGTFHRSPAHGAGWLASAWASVLQGRLMHSAATGDEDDGFGHWHLSRMRRPYRTRGFPGIQTRHCVPGLEFGPGGRC